MFMGHDIYFMEINKIPKNKQIGPSEVRATSGQHLGGHYFT